MLYPKLINVKKSKETIYILSFLNIFLFIMMLIINYTFSGKLNWSIIAIVSIVYIWRTVYITLKKNKNLASYIFSQLIYLSALLYIIDFALGNKGWSLSIGIPIVIMVTNFTMMIITLIKYRKYIKYALYEIMILIVSIAYNIFLCVFSGKISILNGIAFWISLSNLAFVLSLNAKTLFLEFQKRFHI